MSPASFIAVLSAAFIGGAIGALDGNHGMLLLAAAIIALAGNVARKGR